MPAQQETAAPSPAPATETTPAIAVETGDAATPAAARQVVVDYYAAIDAGDHAKAYALWSDDGAASGQTFEHFSGGYANTKSVRAAVGEPTDEEGAAGSRYIQVPVELSALQRDGSERRYRGRFTLRAVVADGASDEQRRWHLASAEMQRITQ
ncbi:hypothetical protein CSC73_01600 [Pseudoxanthomonas sacheonensis]|nr:hypothetical protein CSC73_01600 [Pseudoxanthomonas sacheonensis]